MANVRYKVVETLSGVAKSILDRQEGRAYAIGIDVLYAGFAGTHRQSYTHDDAQAVCDMLNQREATATS